MWCRAALIAYDGIFPDDAPPPSVELLTERARQAIAAQGHHDALVLVACLPGPDRPVVGTVAAVPDPAQSTRAQLLRLYVDPGHWGRGIGRRLHDEALDHLRAAGFRVAVAWVLEGNLRARTISERWGWRPTPAVSTAYPGVREVCYLLTL